MIPYENNDLQNAVLLAFFALALIGLGTVIYVIVRRIVLLIHWLRREPPTTPNSN